MRERKEVGIIGYGNMGSAIAERIKKKYRVFIFDKDNLKTQQVRQLKVAVDLKELVAKSDVIILAVKPQDFEVVLNDIKVDIDEKLVISIAAGIHTKFIEKILGEVRVIRAMPNLPGRIGEGISCLCKGRFATSRDLQFALMLFRFLGFTFVFNEDMMDAATAVCGSGPGFWGYAVEHIPRDKWKEYSKNILIPEFSHAAESVGFAKEQSRVLAERTIMGSLATVEAWHITPQELRKQVASKGGTTEAGLEVLESGGSWMDAVRMAVKRAQQLSKS